MNILIISQYAGGPELGDEQRPYLLARQWMGEGDRVAIIAADHSRRRRQNPLVEQDLEKKVLDQVEYAFITTPPDGREGESRDRSIDAFAKKLRKLAPQIVREFAPDVVVAASDHPYDIFAARRIAKRARGGLVFELHKNWPDLEEEEQGRAPRLARRAMRTALDKSDRVVSLLPRGQEYLEALKVPREKAVYIPDIPGLPADRGLSPRRREYLERLRAGYDFLVLYEGDVTWDRGLGRLIDAAKLLEEQGVAAVILGSGNYKVTLRRHMRDTTAANVYILDKVEEGERQELYRYADCLYYGDERASAVRYGVSSEKLMEQMASGVPVVTALQTDESPVELAGCGLNVRERDAAALARALAQLKAATPAQRQTMGERGRDFLRENCNLRDLSQKYRRLLAETMTKK